MYNLRILIYLTSVWSMSFLHGVLAQPVQQDYTMMMTDCEGMDRPYSGRLEMLYLYQWGTICGDSFDKNAAGVACYSLGYQRDGADFTLNEYNCSTDKPIVMNGIKCIGNETHLDGCSHAPYSADGNKECNHLQDVHVSCQPNKYSNGNDILGYQIKLCNHTFNCTSENERMGLLQIKYNEKWGTVCSSQFNFNEEELRVACRSVIRNVDESVYEIYGTYTRYDEIDGNPPNYEADDRVPIWIGGVECTGSERNLGSCRHPAWGVNTCSHYNDVWLSCHVRPKKAKALHGDLSDEAIQT